MSEDIKSSAELLNSYIHDLKMIYQMFAGVIYAQQTFLMAGNWRFFFSLSDK